MRITKQEVAEVIKNSDKECKELDFSIFHPLDHWAFSRYCFSWHGGGIRHLKLWWEFQRPGWDKNYVEVEDD